MKIEKQIGGYIIIVSKCFVDGFIKYFTNTKWFTYYKTRETNCSRCKKNTTNKISNTKRTKQNRLVLISNCAIGSKKKSKFIKNQEASGLLNGLGIRTPLNNVPVIGNILF